MSDVNATLPKPPIQRENFLVNLVCNLLLPILALKQLSSEARLGPTMGLIVALAFPVGYFVYDYARRRNVNLISILGFLNIFLTGGIGLMGKGPNWIVAKETAIPLVIGAMVLVTAKSPKSLLKTFLLNDQLFDLEKIHFRVDTTAKKAELESYFRTANWLLCLSFIVGAALNFTLASMIVKSQGGTEAFNQEIATLNWVSWLVITVPTMSILIFALYRLIKGLTKITGLTFEELLHAHPAKKP